MKCSSRGQGWPTAKVDTYWGPEGPKAFCNACLFAEFQAQSECEVVIRSAWYVAPNGSEYELPSYGS